MQQSIALFVDKGYSATSIQDIVDALGVTKGSFYYHYKSKDALLMDIHQQYIDELLARQESILQGAAPATDKLAAIVCLLIGDMEKQGPIANVYFRELRHLKEENAKTIRAKRAEFREQIESVLLEGIESGEFRKELNPKMTAFAVLGVTNWSYQWFQPGGELATDELAQLYTDFILHGIMPAQSKKP
ncbi:TetR/AcrR family transcriptional regulator [Planococcus alpniumensis]|uniref:TetR/AcrR family transcriptional regulator n=1 Tax=Planococcus alpniumensis TaxID=2708345 RepID=UPI0020118BA1|nr:TetR/AcrR family transcriptional regulator [Planococcus sp. MSAK28401]